MEKKNFIFGLLMSFMLLISSNTSFGISEDNSKAYSKVTKDESIMSALDVMQGTLANYSREAILGNNLSNNPIKIEFKNLSEMGEAYTNFDALGWKKKGKLYIFINPKHQDAPKEALAALLSHEALHQDEFNSINEETYAWTLEAAVWTQFCEDNPELTKVSHPLATRENIIKKLFEKGNYTDTYIRKSIISNPGYQNLPSRSPGFEDNL